MKKLIALLAATALLLTGCKQTAVEPLTYNDTFFDTIISVTLYDHQSQALLQKIKALCQKYDKTLSRQNPDSEISQINRAQGAPVTVSAETAEVIRRAQKYSQQSGGAFDITIGAVNDLWDFKSDAKKVPDAAALKAALTHVDYRQVTVSGTQVTLADPDAQLDLGGIAKGFIADKLKDLLVKNKVGHALINLGGNILAIGDKPDGSPYNIGIQKPFAAEGTPLTSVKITDTSSVTSGVYERYFKVGNKLYHHLLDPATGYPCENDLLSVTIITKSSTKADALSTACFVLGLEKGSELIRAEKDTKAIFVTSDYKVHNVE